MATSNNKRINVSELDFDNIKTSLKSFLKGQSEFSDYDYEGSALSTLLDILAYNTHYNGIYTNLAVNEMFLDSASKRSSVVSLAKMLGYTPRSARSARATVNVSIMSPTSHPDVVTLPSMQPFLTKIDNVSYTFYNVSDVTVAVGTNGTYNFNNLEIIEGTPLQNKYIVQSGARYIIPNSNVDISTIKVRVQETAGSDTFETFTLSETITQVDNNSKVYFIKEIDDGLYELTFGDGVIGRQLSEGNVINIEYFVSSLEAANNTSQFTYNGVQLLGSNLSVSIVNNSYGGASVEDISSIKFNAPRLYSSQNRTVTPDDYKSIVYNLFPQAKSITVWGGEDNSPPIYGKTFICVKPKDSERLTNIQKEYIVNTILSPRSIVSISPTIIDPEYFEIELTSYVYYNPRETTKTVSEIETIVKDAILDYNETELGRFDSILRFSKLSKLIDDSDNSITNNITRLVIKRQFEPIYNISSEYKIYLINPISQEGNKNGDVISSSGFYIPNSTDVHYLDDDSNGNIRLYYLNTNFDKVIVNPTIGTVDYTGGLITVRNLVIVSLASPTFYFTIKPDSYDVVSALNQIVQISAENLTVNAIADTTASGDTGAGTNYTFQSIRS